MSIASRALLIIALLGAASIARSEGIFNPTAGGWLSFTGGIGSGGIGNAGVPVVVASCPSPTAPDGTVDLSKCSNSFYLAVIF